MPQTREKKTTSVVKNVAMNMELPVKAFVELELWAVIWFLALKGEMAIGIHRELERVYGVGVH